MRKLIGIGAGPSHLSLAALAEPVSQIECTLLEKSPDLSWHPGLLLDDAGLQVSFLKDLVTPVDPTNRFSFLNYLKTHKRLYQFISADFEQTLRLEFDAYLQWVARSLRGINYNATADNIRFSDTGFKVGVTDGRSFEADSLSIGVGQRPWVPDFMTDLIGRRVFHSSQLLLENPVLRDEDVVIVGSGQSAAETFLACLDGQFGMPSSVYWLSRAQHFKPIDETALTNEIFTPAYIDFFHGLPVCNRDNLNAELRFTSDGISPKTSQAVMQRLYRLRFLEGGMCRATLRPGVELIGAVQHDQRFGLALKNRNNGQTEHRHADRVILCTGYETCLPDMLDELRDDLVFENDKIVFNADYSARWKTSRKQQLFVCNGAMHSHGIADPNLSLMAYRSATILNSLSNPPLYDLGHEKLIDWGGESPVNQVKQEVDQIVSTCETMP